MENVTVFLGYWVDNAYWENSKRFINGTLILFTAWLFFFFFFKYQNNFISSSKKCEYSKSFTTHPLFLPFGLKSHDCFFLQVRGQGLANFRARTVNMNILGFAGHIDLYEIFYFVFKPSFKNVKNILSLEPHLSPAIICLPFIQVIYLKSLQIILGMILRIHQIVRELTCIQCILLN